MPYSAEVLRQRFAHASQFHWPSDWPLDTQQVAAAVLIALLPRPHGVQVLLTRRTEHLHHHAGQISFPGGRVEEHDASLEAAALRETHEEIGVAPECVELLGVLPDFATPSGFRITPVVGLVSPELPIHLDEFEVAEVFELPLRLVADRTNYQSHRIAWQGKERLVYAIPYSGRFIWGATAGILHMLAGFLATRP